MREREEKPLKRKGKVFFILRVVECAYIDKYKCPSHSHPAPQLMHEQINIIVGVGRTLFTLRVFIALAFVFENF